MSFNPNFYNDLYGSNFTFQNNFMPPTCIPPPPLPPPYFLSLASSAAETSNQDISDQEFIRRFETVPGDKKTKRKTVSITELKIKLQNLVVTLNDIKDKEQILRDNINVLSESEWITFMAEIDKHKALINNTMAQINESYLDMLRKLLAKRASKRLRLKRLCVERRKENRERIKELEERSRKIDENLQKIKDDINKAKQEEEAKLQADIVLKEVLRKKHDAKKCIVKLDALMKLRKARQNTARGRGESVSENDAAAFIRNIEKLKSLWCRKLAAYDKEEIDLRVTLKQDTVHNVAANEKDKEVLVNMAKWREFLFGDSQSDPQADFQGDLWRFIAARSQWDQYTSSEGTPLPVGWVLPNYKTS